MENSSNGTARQRMMLLLGEMEMTAIDLSQELGMSEKEVYDHLPHVARSAGSRGKRLVIMPAQCLKCGYVFRERRRFTPPGRCPRCRETHLQRPAYRIE